MPNNFKYQPSNFNNFKEKERKKECQLERKRKIERVDDTERGK